MVGAGAAPLQSADPVFYFLCAFVGLFCVIALGYGPLLFVLLGGALAVVGFRRRLRHWWGLPAAGAGVGLVMSVALGWRWHHVVEAVVGAFLLVGVARVAGRAVDRRSAVLRR